MLFKWKDGADGESCFDFSLFIGVPAWRRIKLYVSVCPKSTKEIEYYAIGRSGDTERGKQSYYLQGIRVRRKYK